MVPDCGRDDRQHFGSHLGQIIGLRWPSTDHIPKLRQPPDEVRPAVTYEYGLET